MLVFFLIFISWIFRWVHLLQQATPQQVALSLLLFLFKSLSTLRWKALMRTMHTIRTSMRTMRTTTFSSKSDSNGPYIYIDIYFTYKRITFFMGCIISSIISLYISCSDWF